MEKSQEEKKKKYSAAVGQAHPPRQAWRKAPLFGREVS